MNMEIDESRGLISLSIYSMSYMPKRYRQVNKNKTWAVNILHLHLHERGGCMATTIPAKLSHNRYIKWKIARLLVIAKHLTFINTSHI